MQKPMPTAPCGPPSKALLAGVFLISLSILMLEVVFARILSFILSYHYVFLVVSMAMLGLGLGGIVAQFRRPRAGECSLPRWMGALSLSASATIFIIIRMPYLDSFLVYGLLVLAPFICAGVALSGAFRTYAGRGGHIYAADLAGAAAGALLAVPALDALDAIGAGLLASLFAAIGCLMVSNFRVRRVPWLAGGATMAAAILLVTTSALPALKQMSVGQSDAKEMSDALSPGQSGKIIATRWNSFGRTDLVQFPDEAGVMAIYLDGTAGAPMHRFTGDPGNPGPAGDLKTTFPGFFPFYSLTPDEKDSALIIGPGGGRDVLLALMGEVGQITAVDVNNDMIELVKEYSSYNGGIYTSFPNVDIVRAEGRNYLRRQNRRFDLIMLSLPITKTSRSPEGFALTENFLFTRESMNEYLDHLTPEGRLVVVAHGAVEVLRLITLASEALAARGVPQAETMDYVYSVGNHSYSLFVLSKQRVTPEMSVSLHELSHYFQYDPAHAYFPYIKPTLNANHVRQGRFEECQMLSPTLIALSNGSSSLTRLRSAAAESGYDIGTVTDNRPFFYNFTQSLPESLNLSFWLALLLLVVAIIVPAMLVNRGPVNTRQRPPNAAPRLFPFLFAMLGVGFMIAEVSLIQRFILFLGEPVMATTVLLFSILLGAGAGGLASARIKLNGSAGKIGAASASIAVAMVAYAYLAPPLLEAMLDLPLTVRVLTAVAILTPLGFIMGIPFPLGIRLMAEQKHEGQVPWMWGINGAASVLGSAAAIIIAMKLGFTEALLAGAACYLLVALSQAARLGRPGRS